MTISELICRLQAIKCEHGDLEILLNDTAGWNGVSNVEMQTLDDGEHNLREFACIY